MKKWVEEKLHIIDDLYPDERIERSKRRLRKLWAGEMPDDRYPFLYAPLQLNYYDQVHLPEERLRLSLDEHIARGRIEDDFIPSLFPGCRQGTIPSMFGAKEMVVDGSYSSARLIHGLKDIDALPEPSIGPGTVAHEWLEMQRYFLEETEGRLPVNVVDMQGPVEVCAKLWGYDDFFLAAYSEPGHCHRLMDKLTDAFILFWEAQQKLLGSHFVGTHLWGWNWVPENSGATLSSDGVVMVSPDFYDEFYNPSTIRIGEHFGGVTIHSCGNFSVALKNMIAPRCVRGIHAGQMNLRDIVKAGLTRNVVCTAGSSMKDIEADFLAAKANCVLSNLTIGNFWPENSPGQWTEAQWRDIQYLHEQVVEWASVR
jgi:hypothetical protein